MLCVSFVLFGELFCWWSLWLLFVCSSILGLGVAFLLCCFVVGCPVGVGGCVCTVMFTVWCISSYSFRHAVSTFSFFSDTTSVEIHPEYIVGCFRCVSETFSIIPRCSYYTSMSGPNSFCFITWSIEPRG